MFLPAKVREGDGELQGHFSVVENRLVGVKNRTLHLTVLHLGEIDNSREAA